MILTGSEIARAQELGDVSIQPFSSSNINPNSYNFHLGMKLFRIEKVEQSITPALHFTDQGVLLEPGSVYLGTTHERIGSPRYAITLLGRSSIGRLGIFLNATADLGHVGSNSNWTLEISVVQPVRVYPLMRIGQVAFWVVEGTPQPYSGRYKDDINPEPSKDPTLSGTKQASQ